MKAPRRVSAIGVLLVPVVVLGLGACGDGADQAGPPTPTSTTAAGADLTATSSPNATSAPPAVPPTAAPTVPAIEATVSGQVLGRQIADAARREGSLTFAFVSKGEQDVAGNGVADSGSARTNLRLTATVGGSDQALAITKKDGAVFLKPPTPIEGKPWVQVSDSPKDLFWPLYEQVYQGLEITGDVPAVGAVVADISRFSVVARESIDGVTTTKYTATPPAEVGIALLPQVSTAYSSDTLKKARTVVTLWVSADGVLRRGTTVLTLKGKPGTSSLTTYSGWGKPVTVTAPPSSQVTTMIRPGG